MMATTTPKAPTSLKKPKKRGRKRVAVLSQRPIQTMVLKRIVQTGKEEGCWENICTRRNYFAWKARNLEEWGKRVNAAIKQHYNHETLADPNFKTLVIKSLYEDLKAGKLTPTEKMRLLQFLPDIHE